MPWGKVTIAAPNAAGYTQNYKRNGVVTHTEAQAMVQAAIADSTARIPQTLVTIPCRRRSIHSISGKTWPLIQGSITE